MAATVGATLSGVTFAPRHSGEGPFMSSGGNVYFFGRNSASTQQVLPLKASDPMSAFTAQTGKTVSGSGPFEALGCYQVGQVVHCATQMSTGATYYNFYTMDTDTWGLATSETAVAAAAFAPTTGYTLPSLVVRSGGEVVIAYCAGLTAMSSGFNMVRYTRRTGTNTWSSPVNVDNGGSVNWANGQAVLGASDRVHFFFSEPANSRLYQRALSAANALQASTTGTSQFASTFATILAYGNGVQEGSSVAVPFYGSSTTPQRQAVVRLTSADSPTPAAESVGNVTPGVTNNEPRIALANDSGTLHYLHVNSTDSDLYHQDDAGTGTWGAATNELTATINAVTANVYTRGGTKYLAMVLDDGAVIKYAEITLTAAAPASFIWPTETPYRILSRR